jgi:hypothetical protein
MYFDQLTHCGFDRAELNLWHLGQDHDSPLLQELRRRCGAAVSAEA